MKKPRKFLCIGGPFDGQLKTYDVAKSHEYHDYNRASRWNGWTEYRQSRDNTCVFIHRDLLLAGSDLRRGDKR